MYVFKNAIKNLCRNKGRNIIIGIIILTMLTFTAISIIINTTTENVIKNYKEQFGSQIYIQTDIEKMKDLEKNGEWVMAPEIPDEIKLRISESEHLKETLIRAVYPAYSPDLKGLDQGKNESDSNIETKPSAPSGYYDINLRVLGYNSIDLLTAFKEGKRRITSGKLFEKDNECITSEDYAKLNNLKIGDKIKVLDCEKTSKFDALVLTITGIFYDETKSEFGNYISAATNPKNDILTTFNTLKNYEDTVAKKNLFAVDTTYFLKNPDLLEQFNEEAHKKGLDQIYIMSTDELSYNKIVKPAENLANVSNIFLTTVLLIGGIILILLSVLSIRERKYEIGVLRAIGMKKVKVVRGIVYEALITTAICLVLGLSIGGLLAQPVSNIINDTTNEQQQNNNLGMPVIETEPINVSLNAQAVANVSCIAIVIAIISSCAGVLYILQYEPMKILSEGN